METISVRSGNLSEFLAYIKQRGLSVRVDRSNPEYLNQFGDDRQKCGYRTIGVGDKIFYIAIPTTIGALPEYFLLNIE